MYIPPHFNQKDINTAIAFMQRFSFAMLITTSNKNEINVTHLPFVVEQNQRELILTSHMAKANQQWKDFSHCKTVVVFREPHAYISPSLYEKAQNVPTWNYMAVHVTGNAKTEDDETKGYELLEKMISFYEKEYMQQWKNLDTNYKQKLFKGLIPFYIYPDKIECKEKLSQNKTANEKEKITNHLLKNDDAEAVKTGELMKRKYNF